MKTYEKAQRRSTQLDRALENLFHDDEFLSQIKKLRTEVGIPQDGYKKFDEYFEYLKKDLKSGKGRYIVKIEPRMYSLAKEHGLTSNYSFWIEAFLAMGFNYRGFEQRTPRNHPREHFIHGRGVALDIQHDRDDHILLKIFAGSSINEIVNFVRANKPFIKKLLEERTVHGKAPDVRRVGDRDRKAILAFADEGLIDSAGAWWGSLPRPACLMKGKKELSNKQIKTIITAERKRRKQET